MKKLLLTTALLTFSTLGGTSIAFADAGENLTEAQFTVIYKAMDISATATGFHTGDYQVIAKSLHTSSLYDGSGSALMKTMRLERY